MNNLGYFFREMKTILRLNGFSGVLSVVSMSLIFFVALLAVTGWWVSSEMVRELRAQAEISVYYPQAASPADVETLKHDVQSVSGVRSVTSVSADEAKASMSKILGPEAQVLSHFDKNPFEAYLEVNVDLSKLESVLKAVKVVKNVEYVRDNRSVLNRLSAITSGISALSLIVASAVCVAAFIITAHIIREGVHSHRDRIYTLKLLGAPNGFINAPFILEGVLLTTISGLVASGAFMLFFSHLGQGISGSLLFLPAVDYGLIRNTLAGGILAVSVVMGALASVFGLGLVKDKG